jgi:hypothetical protein
MSYGHRVVGRLVAAAVLAGLVGIAGCVEGPGSMPDRPTGSPSSTAVPTDAEKRSTQPDARPPSTAEFGPLPPGFHSWAEVLDVQQTISAAAGRINAAAGAVDALAGMVAQPESRQLTVYWKGSMPAETERLVAEIRTGLTLQVRPARGSATELAAAGRAVLGRAGVVAVSANVDGSGITVTVDSDVDVAGWGVRVPVTVRHAGKPFFVVCSRQVDCAPFWGGAQYWSPTSICTLGFTVWKDGSPTNEDYNLSAGHCADVGDTITTPGGAFIGQVVDERTEQDTLLIKNPIQYFFDGRIFTSTWNAMSGYNRRPVGKALNVVGLYVCTSGAATGEHCGLRIEETGIVVIIDGPFGVVSTFGPVVRAANLAGGVAVGVGDSGGPAHMPGADGLTSAMGIINAGLDEVPCDAGVPSTKCGSSVYYVDISAALSAYGMHVATSPGFTWPS